MKTRSRLCRSGEAEARSRAGSLVPRGLHHQVSFWHIASVFECLLSGRYLEESRHPLNTACCIYPGTG